MKLTTVHAMQYSQREATRPTQKSTSLRTQHYVPILTSSDPGGPPMLFINDVQKKTDDVDGCQYSI